MKIPEEAVEAAAKAAFLSGYARRTAVPDPDVAERAWEDRGDAGRGPYCVRAREYLEVAAPFIAAQAWDDGFEDGYDYHFTLERFTITAKAPSNPYRDESA